MKDLERLENSLWEPTTRYDRVAMEAVLSDDFLEFGRSGKRYTRNEVISIDSTNKSFEVKLHDVECLHLGSNVVLVTYRSEVHYGKTVEWANRSSLWDKSSGAWRLRFHQGTPTKEEI